MAAGGWGSAASRINRGASRALKPRCGAARRPWRRSLSPAHARHTTTRSKCRWSSARSPRCWPKRRVEHMKFDTPAGSNPIDQLKVVGKPVDRIDGPLKTTGTAPYAYERHDVAPNAAYGFIVGSAIAKGRITSMDVAAARAAPGVIAIVTAQNAGKLAKGNFNTALLLGGPQIQHYHQAIALVVAETFEQARAAAKLVRTQYQRTKGAYELAAVKDTGRGKDSFAGPPETTVGDFA